MSYTSKYIKGKLYIEFVIIKGKLYILLKLGKMAWCSLKIKSFEIRDYNMYVEIWKYKHIYA